MPFRKSLRAVAAISLLVSSFALVHAQDRLPTMPRYDRYTRMSREIAGSVKSGALNVRWSDDGKSFVYAKDGKTYTFDVAKKEAKEGGESPPPPARNGRRGGSSGQRPAPDRGRQFSVVLSDDGKLKAFYKDRNVFISDAKGGGEYAVTTEGNAKDRTKFGIASWVYGEELGVREAMWWSPDAKLLAFYKFDESKALDYFLQMKQVNIQDELDVEAYPKAGAPNPEVTLLVYDLASKKTTRIDTSFDGGAGKEVGHYVYSVRWSPDGKELLFNRTNRKQNIMEFCAADPSTGNCRVIIREKDAKAWTDNSPMMQYLEENGKPTNKFLWRSERTGYYNLYLYDLTGKLYNAVTKNDGFEVASIVKVDPAKNTVWYLGRDGDNPYKLQLHRVGLDGKGDKRLTDPAFNHSAEVSPDGSHFIDVAQRLDTPATTTLRDANGKELVALATSDTSKFEGLKLQKGERFTYTAADGKTICYGTLFKPSDFDPAKKYPLLVSVYGGPESSGGPEGFATPSAITEFGFLVASFDGRGTSGRGKAFKNELYQKLGIVEIDDQAAGVKALRERPYVDGSRVGIFGTSYGGYSSVMTLLRYPDVFQAASASSPVTDWLNYDSVYTERYDGLPWDGENKDGYANGSAMKYAGQIKGRLLLYYGTSDNNVHPANSLQLVRALAAAGKSFDMMVGPDLGHTGVNFARMLEFFIDNLVLRPGQKDGAQLAWDERKAKRRSARKAP